MFCRCDKISLEPPQTQPMGHVWTWPPMDYGEADSRKLIWTLESSTLSHHPTDIATSQHATVETRTRKREYKQRILEIEHASFSPIVMSCTGGLGRSATSTYKRLASLLADKWNQAYSPTMCWLCCTLSFSFLRSTIQATRGSRSSSGKAHLSTEQ